MSNLKAIAKTVGIELIFTNEHRPLELGVMHMIEDSEETILKNILYCVQNNLKTLIIFKKESWTPFKGIKAQSH